MERFLILYLIKTKQISNVRYPLNCKCIKFLLSFDLTAVKTKRYPEWVKTFILARGETHISRNDICERVSDDMFHHPDRYFAFKATFHNPNTPQGGLPPNAKNWYFSLPEELTWANMFKGPFRDTLVQDNQGYLNQTTHYVLRSYIVQIVGYIFNKINCLPIRWENAGLAYIK